ncbi:cytochrome c-550 PedF [Rhodobacter capsulatus]|jgi:cytochrome c-550 PedF|uniref:Cytochrome c domain protein n=1 Tax=Rhodobacter capsulatus (strain ATCC BAA-309 / NBRC 16581 / SB1003) TaxID=272942 RepID=D5ATV2_RHOCB|nr:cytochrome c-550 PedF [Rhodobacter capsulatus]ADE85391.1 cytochrome c domain protein [Rhodobacter capsulatus SB 1003]ETD01432.1 cytochrome C550 [Rhodobacter capsulatus DE442]ETD77145.1 cytochrome C550 [Rhodobacter capsulatus R121]ETD81472.1 cytochrome C550 [Rhodobacter capsulatus B6]ETD84642.1 cytochrome C550 [Rhodobacter capsulatus YW1]
MLDVRNRRFLAALLLACLPGPLLAHGDVTPQPVNTDALPEVGEEWLTENPYRAEKAGEEVWKAAVKIGDSGFNQNCARCHGLGAVSGGLAPDLRFLEAEEYGDEWFAERFQHGYTQDGTTKMPAFGPVLGQKAGWAIRTYIETRPEDGALDSHTDRLRAIVADLEAGTADGVAVKEELEQINSEVKTFSGAPVADSTVSRAAEVLSADKASFKHAAELLSLGLSAAK